jgi:hypothetical protein
VKLSLMTICVILGALRSAYHRMMLFKALGLITLLALVPAYADLSDDIGLILVKSALNNVPTEIILRILGSEFKVTELPVLQVRLASKPSEVPEQAKKSVAFVLNFEGKPKFLVINPNSRMWREMLQSYHQDPQHSAAPYLLSAVIGHEIVHAISRSQVDLLPYTVELAILEYHEAQGNMRNFPNRQKYMSLVRERLEHQRSLAVR